MKTNIRRFVLSFFITLIIFSMIAGIYAVTYKGSLMTEKEKKVYVIDYEDTEAIGKTADNIMTFFFPEEKAAAQFIAILCAALSKLY